MVDVFRIIQLATQFGGSIKTIIDEAETNDDIVTKVTKLSPVLASVLADLGSTLFPNAAPALHLVGAAIATFDPSTTKWLQKGLNSILGTNLTVDGSYGPKTRAAVTQLQEKYGLKADGIAANVTQALLQALLNKVPTLAPAPKAA